MKKFLYSFENGNVHAEVHNMDLNECAAAIGSAAREVYSTLYRQDPKAAGVFKTAVVVAIAHPDSPVWEVKELDDDTIAIVAMGKKPK